MQSHQNRPHPNTAVAASAAVTDIIAAHRAALLEDEASFSDDGLAISDELVERTGAAEQAAYLAFVHAPCQTANDVQAKLDYILNGSVGVRETLLQCLAQDGECFEDWLLEPFLRSLLLADAARGSRAYAPGATPSRACACEEA